MTTNERTLFVAALALLGLGALPGCSGSEPAAAQSAPPETVIHVAVAPVDRTPIREAVALPGLVHPRDTFELGFPAGGVILEVAVDEGAEVRRGDVLARLDATAMRASMAQAREGLGRAERDLARAAALAESGSVTTATYEDARTGAEVARASVSAAGFALRYATLRAPEDGWIDARLADAREVVGAGQPVLRLASRARGWVLRIAVPDRAVARMHEGDGAEITLDALPEQPIAARIVEIARMPSPATGTYDVDLAFDAPASLTMRTGLIGRASIPIGAAHPASVPLSALVDGHDHDAAVFVIEGERARRRAVRVAFFERERAVLATDLEGIEQVITIGAERLDEGARVAPFAE